MRGLEGVRTFTKTGIPRPIARSTMITRRLSNFVGVITRGTVLIEGLDSQDGVGGREEIPT